MSQRKRKKEDFKELGLIHLMVRGKLEKHLELRKVVPRSVGGIKPKQKSNRMDEN